MNLRLSLGFAKNISFYKIFEDIIVYVLNNLLSKAKHL